ncbi:hypothetical protein [Neobacillus ginsengisoli]|uniref:Uncharacterized protein n=1 Tax=Neobacillus ginsengisoli TaxID=904295 RepID=A0ABT9XNG2_9BACI|nr:hypothetical protein [Neobacillus ginsengisoli]MDQ0197091.1 hypothetical protein [Neobacillus ginsengisoli]
MNTRTIVFFPFFKVSRAEQMQLENLLLGIKSYVMDEFKAFVPLTHPTMAALHEFPTLMEIFDYFYTATIDDLLASETYEYGS